MTRTPRRAFLVTSGATLLAIALPQLAMAQAAAPKNRALFSVTDNDQARWTMILNNIQNLFTDGVTISGTATFPVTIAGLRGFQNLRLAYSTLDGTDLTSLMHKFPETGDFGQKMQTAELDYLVHSTAASTALAENYVGLPL